MESEVQGCRFEHGEVLVTPPRAQPALPGFFQRPCAVTAGGGVVGASSDIWSQKPQLSHSWLFMDLVRDSERSTHSAAAGKHSPDNHLHMRGVCLGRDGTLSCFPSMRITEMHCGYSGVQVQVPSGLRRAKQRS